MKVPLHAFQDGCVQIFEKYKKSVLQSREIILKDNKNFSFSYFMNICSCRLRPGTLLFNHIYIHTHTKDKM